jgi:hypothetical protein
MTNVAINASIAAIATIKAKPYVYNKVHIIKNE